MNATCEYVVKKKVATNTILYAVSINFQLLSTIHLVLDDNFLTNVSIITIFHIFRSSSLDPYHFLFLSISIIGSEI